MIHLVKPQNGCGKISMIILNRTQSMLDEVKNQIENTDCILEAYEIQQEEEKKVLTDINEAIKRAAGDYLYIFLNDDVLNVKQLENVIEFQMKNSACVDVTAFTQIIDVENYNEKTDGNITGIYNCKIEPEYQIKMFNYIVKRSPEVLMPENVSIYCACREYFLHNVSEKGKFGFVKEDYQQHFKDVWDLVELDSFEEYVNEYSCLLTILEREERETKWISYLTQATVLRSLNEILSESMLIPESFTESEKKILEELLRKIIKKIDDEILSDRKKYDHYKLLTYLNYKYENLEIKADVASFGVYHDNQEFMKWKTIGCYVFAIKYENNVMKLYCSFQNPIFGMIPFKIYRISGGCKELIEVKESELSYRGSRQKIADVREYVLEIPVGQKVKYSFKAEINNYQYPVKLSYHKQIKLNQYRDKKRLFHKGTRYILSGKSISANKISVFGRLRELKWDRDNYYKINKAVAKERDHIRLEKFKSAAKVYLYMNTKDSEDFLKFYLNEQNKKDGIKRVYCQRDKKVAIETVSGVLSFRGEEVLRLMPYVKKVITDTPGFRDYCPVTMKNWEYYCDLYDFSVTFWHKKDAKPNVDLETLYGLKNIDDEIVV